MKRQLAFLLVLLVLGVAWAAAQRARRPAPAAAVTVARSVTLRITVASDAVGIFEFLADPQKLSQWFPDQAIMEARFGGKYHFRWRDTQGVWSGVITEFVRGNTLAYTWQPPGEAYETNVRYRLSPQGAETMVELSHSGFTTSAAQEKAVQAWVFYLQNLKSVVEEGTDLREQTRRTRRPTRRAAPR